MEKNFWGVYRDMKSISPLLQVFIIRSLPFPPLIDLTIGFLYSAGEVACDWKVFAYKVLPSLFRFYDHGSIRHRRAADVYNTDWISSEIAGDGE